MNQPAPALRPDDPASLAADVGERARALYGPRRLFCSEAVLVAVNETFGCGLEKEQAVALAAALPVGLGGSGCLCGALSGAAMALGLALAMEPDPCDRKTIREASAQLHDAFKAVHGAACCRTLVKKVKHDKKAHLAQCEGLTAWAAEAVAARILALRPDLAASASPAGASGRRSPAQPIRPRGGLLRFAKRLTRRFRRAP